jgi:hypothetical protein
MRERLTLFRLSTGGLSPPFFFNRNCAFIIISNPLLKQQLGPDHAYVPVLLHYIYLRMFWVQSQTAAVDRGVRFPGCHHAPIFLVGIPRDHRSIPVAAVVSCYLTPRGSERFSAIKQRYSR